MQIALKCLVSLVFGLCSLTSAASCPPHSQTDPAQVRLTGDSVLIVTHASSNDDGRISTKLGVDEAVRFAKSKKMQVIYLEDDRPASSYFMDDCNPDYWIFSEGGEIKFDLSSSHIYIVGGHLEICLSETLHQVLLKWARKPERNLTVTYFMDGIYSNGREIEESDPYYKDFEKFMEIATYGRPAGEHFPKLTLLETMGVIKDEARQIAYLTRILPRYERSFVADYRVQMKMDDSLVKVLRRGRAGRPPVLTFEFFHSAADLN